MIEVNPVNILGAVRQFITTNIWNEPDLIFNGWQNRSSLPDDTEYAVLTLSGVYRRGTNTHKYAFSETGFSEKARFMNVYDVQADFCGLDQEVISRRAATLGLLIRDRIAADFFKQFNLASLYADDPRALTFVDDQNQWLIRYSIDIHLCGWIEHSSELDAFEAVNINLEDVDVHHKAGAN